MSRFRFRIVFLCPVILPLLLLGACTGDEGPIGPEGPTGPQGDPGPSLAIHTLDVSPPVVVVGDTAEVRLDFVHEGAGEVSIDWEADAGELLQGDEGTRWVAPEEPGFYVLNVELRDGILAANGRHTVQVIDQPTYTDGPFSLEILLEDWEGEPHVDRNISFQVETPGFAEADLAAEPGTWIPVLLEHDYCEELDVALEIYGDGELIRRDLYEDMPLGLYQLYFDGRDSTGAAITGTRILRHAVRTFIPNLDHQQAAMSWSMVIYDPRGNGPGTPIGTTDSSGRVYTDDASVFPFLSSYSSYCNIYDAAGTWIAPLQLPNRIEVLISDRYNRVVATRELEIGTGGNHHVIRWGWLESAPPAEPEYIPLPMSAVAAGPMDIVPPSCCVSGPNYPNPFWVEQDPQ